LVSALPTCEVRFLRAPLDLLDVLEGSECLHIVDACLGAGKPGTIVRREWPVTEFGTIRFGSTHDVDLLAVLKLAERFQTLPSRVTIWGVQVADGGVPSDFRRDLSPPVAEAAEQVANRITVEINSEHAAEATRHA
jgi:hydrogenase maturation protease